MTMNRKNQFACVIPALLTFLLTSPSHAEFVLSFGLDGSPGLSSFAALPGSQVSIDVFVVENTGTRLNDEGVGAVFFDLDITGSGVRHVPDNGFLLPMDSTFRVVTAVAGELKRSVEIQTGVEVDGATNLAPVLADAGKNYLLLGTVVLQVDSTFEESSSLDAIPDNRFDETGGLIIGNSVFTGSATLGGATATITAVPEPGSVAGLAALVIGGALVHRRRLRGRQAMRTPRNC